MKKNSKSQKSQTPAATNADGSVIAQVVPAKKHPGRAPLTAEQKTERAEARKVAKASAKAVKFISKHIAGLTAPVTFAGLPVETVEAIKTAIHDSAKLRKEVEARKASEIAELEARLTALRGPAPVTAAPATEAAPATDAAAPAEATA
jgi:hypothetical protein